MAVRVIRNEETISGVSDKFHAYSEALIKKLDLADANLSYGGAKAFYGWRPLRYFLFEYELDLQGKSKSNREKLNWEEFCREDYESDYHTIEHIYPQNARARYWTDRFSSLQSRQRIALRNSLGNLLPLSRGKNSSLSNRPFPEKRDGNESLAGYKVGSYCEIEVSQVQDWTPQSVLERGVKLLEFFETRWGLIPTSRSNKVRALRLSFVEYNLSENDGNGEAGQDEDAIPREPFMDEDET